MKRDKVVYLHKWKDTKEVFYVGMGDVNRPKVKGRNFVHDALVDKRGGVNSYYTDIVAERLTQREAIHIETYLIEDHKTLYKEDNTKSNGEPGKGCAIKGKKLLEDYDSGVVRKRKVKKTQEKADKKTPRDYQQKLHDAIIRDLDFDNPDTLRQVVLAAAPGAGKTFIMAMVLNTVHKRKGKGKTLVLSHGQNQLKLQNFEALKEATDLNVGLYDPTHEDNMTHDVVVTIPQSMKGTVDAGDLAKFDFIICDESHQFWLSTMNKTIVAGSKANKILLMTGTPSKFNRKNNDAIKAKQPKPYTVHIKAMKELVPFMSPVQYKIFESKCDIERDRYVEHGKYGTKGDAKTNFKIPVESLKQSVKELAEEVLLVLGAKSVDDIEPTLIACRNTTDARIIKEGLEKALDTKCLLSDSKNDKPSKELLAFQHGYEDWESAQKYGEEPVKPVKEKFCIVVGRGKLGFNMPTLGNVIDFTFSENPDSIYQLFARVLRKHPDIKTKRFFRVSPFRRINATKWSLEQALSLMCPINLATYDTTNYPKNPHDDYDEYKGEVIITKPTTKKIGGMPRQKTPLIDVIVSMSTSTDIKGVSVLTPKWEINNWDILTQIDKAYAQLVDAYCVITRTKKYSSILLDKIADIIKQDIRNVRSCLKGSHHRIGDFVLVTTGEVPTNERFDKAFETWCKDNPSILVYNKYTGKYISLNTTQDILNKYPDSARNNIYNVLRDKDKYEPSGINTFRRIGGKYKENEDLPKEERSLYRKEDAYNVYKNGKWLHTYDDIKTVSAAYNDGHPSSTRIKYNTQGISRIKSKPDMTRAFLGHQFRVVSEKYPEGVDLPKEEVHIKSFFQMNESERKAEVLRRARLCSNLKEFRDKDENMSKRVGKYGVCEILEKEGVWPPVEGRPKPYWVYHYETREYIDYFPSFPVAKKKLELHERTGPYLIKNQRHIEGHVFIPAVEGEKRPVKLPKAMSGKIVVRKPDPVVFYNRRTGAYIKKFDTHKTAADYFDDIKYPSSVSKAVIDFRGYLRDYVVIRLSDIKGNYRKSITEVPLFSVGGSKQVEVICNVTNTKEAFGSTIEARKATGVTYNSAFKSLETGKPTKNGYLFKYYDKKTRKLKDKLKKRG